MRTHRAHLRMQVELSRVRNEKKYIGRRWRSRGLKPWAGKAENSKFESDLTGHCGNYAHQDRMINHIYLVVSV